MRVEKDGRYAGRCVGANEPILVRVANARFAQSIKLAQQRRPLHLVSGGLGKVAHALLQQKGKERAKHVTTDRFIR